MGQRCQAFHHTWLLVLLLLHAVVASAMQVPVALVTGSTDGIGVTTAKHLAANGYTVLLHGRDESRLARAHDKVQRFAGTASNIVRLPAADLSTVKCCMSLVKSIKEVLERDRNLVLQVLMNNAGVFSERRVVTADGTEQTFAVNVVAPFVLTSHLLPFLVSQQNEEQEGVAKSRRIVIASSISQCSQIRDWKDVATYGERRSFSSHGSYSESKLLDAMLTVECSQRLVQAGLAPSRVTCNCLDPGTVNTKMLLAGWGPCGIGVEQALDEYWLCTSDEVEGVSGKYFLYQSARPAARSAYDPAEREKMWSRLSEIAPDAAKMWEFDWLS